MRPPTFWLGLSSYEKNTDLLVSSRPRLAASHTSRPDVQKPSLFVLVGGRSKMAALRELFGVRRARQAGYASGQAEVHLHLASQSGFHEKPLFIAEGGLGVGVDKSVPTSCPQDVRRRTITREAQRAEKTYIADELYNRLLRPFGDVFCFFCDDLGGLDGVARHLMTWLDGGPQSVEPRIILASSTIPQGAKSESKAKAALLEILESESGKYPSLLASRVEVVALYPEVRMSAAARFRVLKERIMRSSDEVRRRRADARFLFSVTHFTALLDIACDHFAAAPNGPFDFVTGSRYHSPVPIDIESRLAEFLHLIDSPADLISFAAPVLGSSLFLDAYPPGAHHFDPVKIFDSLYHDALLRMCSALAPLADGAGVLGGGFVALVKGRLVESFSELVHESLTPLEIHKRLLDTFKSHWRRVRSTRACLSCLLHVPQHGLPCGHVHCEECVWDYGRPSVEDPWVTRYDACHLCDASLPEEVVVRRHPPTAGVGVFCLDGGGVRGIVSLEILKRIQDAINLPIPLTRFVKVFFGISSGGLITAEICLNGSPIEQAVERFRELAKRVFHRRRGLRLPFIPSFLRQWLAHLLGYFAPFPQLSRLIDLLIWLCTDGLYSPKNIEQALRSTFGSRGILDVSHASSTGTRVGLPVATIDKKPLERIFTNYNGVGDRHKDQDFVVRPKEGLGNVPLWEVGRAASAAPGFFPPKHIHGVGSFQDAGPLVDATLSAVCEVTALDNLLDHLDFLASISTGERHPSNTAETEDLRGLWQNGAVPRLGRLVWEKMGDRKPRQMFQMQPWYHRLTVHFDGDEPMLDDASCMEAAAERARSDPRLLDALPERSRGRYTGSGTILCTIRKSEPGFRELFSLLSEGSAQLIVDGSPVCAVGDAACFDPEGNFRKQIAVDTPGNIDICLREGSSAPRHISRSPFTVERLAALQGLDEVFGERKFRKRRSAQLESGRHKRRRAL